MKNNTKYTITLNQYARTYTIRVYNNSKLTAKYRSYPQGQDFSKYWSEQDIKNYLKYCDYDYYTIK